MSTIDPAYRGQSTQHTHTVFASNATDVILVSNFGTGIQVIPVRFRWTASAVGSVFLTAGTAGAASIFRTQALVNNADQSTPWWDSAIAANTEIRLQVPSTLGKGEFDVWFTVVRGGAGAGALVQ